MSGKSNSAILLFLILTMFCISSIFLFQSAEALNPSELRSWVSVEMPYYSEENILIKMNIVTTGNNLNESIRIEEVISSEEPILVNETTNENGTIQTWTKVIVIKRTAIIEAKFYSDSNTTEFTYAVSSSEYNLQSFGTFPRDEWHIGIKFQTSFNVEFDPRIKYCNTPSPNYFGNYTTQPVEGEENMHLMGVSITHPPTFQNFVTLVFVIPLVTLWILLGSSMVVIFLWRRNLNEFFGNIIAINSAVIVFIPIFQLTTQELKIPFMFTWLDWCFLGLLISYILFTVVCLSQS